MTNIKNVLDVAILNATECHMIKDIRIRSNIWPSARRHVRRVLCELLDSHESWQNYVQHGGDFSKVIGESKRIMDIDKKVAIPSKLWDKRKAWILQQDSIWIHQQERMFKDPDGGQEHPEHSD